ncbi:SRPBCC domain-containing protein [Pseudonocardia sp. KRD291]|uniref:SRPBCC family protein n=1 Tax=Pseudonocardia sp. KRD291 TaxID=2792007 RepID=UPI001C49F259|nr:SRPBCC domain-containing protein [Pseudonocardia sp. KRD291]MBW0104890.1 SRPBCC domain-containing protein [Pseudonocardia sp. KRD291]
MSHEFDIRTSIALPATPEQVWQAVATPEGQAAWFMAVPTEPDADPSANPAVEIWEPPHRLLVRPDATMALEYLVEAADGGTAVLRLVHSGVLDPPLGVEGWGDEFDAMTRAGWDQYFATLREYLTHFPGRAATYAEAEATGEVWERIRDVLGRPDAPGGRVTIDLAGRTLAGEVDYVTDRFLGLRTDGALIRFHERSAIGMPVAVSHHDYTGADPDELSAAWADWLAAPVPAT